MDYNFVDHFRDFHPDLRRNGYTWRKYNPLIKQGRIDYILVTESLISNINACSIESSYCSDHSMIILNLKFNKFIQHKPLWKQNTSMLLDVEYLNTINKNISDIKTQYAVPIL